MNGRSLRYRSADDMPPAMRTIFEAQALVSSYGDTKAPVSKKQRHVKHETGVMNKTEARYAQMLNARMADGDVLWWGFEVLKLRLAKRTWLTVDFLVQLADGGFELHEVKGRKGKRYYATEDGKLKAKFAAEQFPFWPFRIVWPAKGGGWDQELQG